MKQLSTDNGRISSLRRLTLLTQVAVLVLAGFLPFALMGRASAAQLTERKVTIDDSRIGDTSVQYLFQFDFAATDVESVIFEFCDAPLPLSTCATPAGMAVNPSAVTLGGHTGFPANATAFTEVATNTGACNTVTANNSTTEQYCMNRTEASSAAGNDATVTLTGITNPSAADTVYIRIYLYSDNAFATQVHTGTVAAAVVDQLTINGRVQERLDFCVAAVDDIDAVPTDVPTCTALTDTNVDLGIISESTTAIAPVDDSGINGADDDYGIMMLNTNATGGAVVSYFAEDAASVSAGDTHQLKAFRVVPTDCNAVTTTYTDQCFRSAEDQAGDGQVITSGAELFGMYIACIDTSSANGGGSQTLLTGNDEYDGSDETIANAANCDSEAFASGTGELGWNNGASKTAETLVSSATIVDDEVVKLRFGATAQATTPSGNYTVVTTYIATVQF